MQYQKVAPVPRDVRAAETPSVGPVLNGKETGTLRLRVHVGRGSAQSLCTQEHVMKGPAF